MDISDLLSQFLSGPLAQDPQYHNFCDTRHFGGIPNFFDVTSNILFVLAGLFGLSQLHQQKETPSLLHWSWVLFFTASVFIGVGSAYYHWAPTTLTLFWDRLPMAVAFSALISALLIERTRYPIGCLALPVLVILSAASVVYWRYSEIIGQGDLRFYAVVQFGSMLALPLLLLFFKRALSQDKHLFLTLGWYFLAKVTEAFDCQIFHLTQEMISGHTLKHVFAALGIAQVSSYLKSKHTNSLH